MRQITIGRNDAGQRLDKFLSKAVPLLPAGLAQKYIRIKRFKVNGARAQAAQKLQEGDLLSLYINDEFFDEVREEDAFLHVTPNVDIVYEDENILLADKKPGMVVHADDTGETNTLIANIQAYLYQKGEWDPALENAFAPALCNRIDRNTGGIVIAAKTAEALRILNEKIKNREIVKKYLCVVHGAPTPAAGELHGYLYKDAARNKVFVSSRPRAGARTAVTKYRTLAVRGELALLECELITGRTHQIRAQMAAFGHPLLGDGKYGTNEKNRGYNATYQALWSYYLRFAFSSPAGALSYLKGREFHVSSVPFADTFFQKDL